MRMGRFRPAPAGPGVALPGSLEELPQLLCPGLIHA